MIFKSGKEIKEIYLGGRQIAAVYIGGQLVWRSRSYAESAAVIVLTSAALLRAADGITYSAEDAGMFQVRASAKVVQSDAGMITAVGTAPVIAEPYLRIVAPMTGSDVVLPNAEAMPLAAPSEEESVVVAAPPIAEAKIYVYDVEEVGSISSVGGIQKGNAVAADGEVIRPAHVSTPAGAADIAIGTVKALRLINVSGGVQRAVGVNVPGKTVGSANGHGAASAASAVPADGNTDRIKVCAPVQLPMSDIKYAAADSVLPESMYQAPTASSELQIGYAKTNDTETFSDALLLHGSADGTTATGAVIGAARYTPFAAAAYMTTVIVTTPDNYDKTDISILDGLSIEDIDLMAI